jgi:hydrogenase maturation protease
VTGAWDELAALPPERVGDLRPGSRVRLRPRAGADMLAAAVAGRTATVAAIEQDIDGTLQIVVTVDDDPGGDIGHPAHRFFFAPDELEPLGEAGRRVLVAGIGNVFMADDGFGVEVASRLAGRPLPVGVEVRDFGIRGMDLAYALGDGYDAAILVDAAPRGEPPGTLSLIEPDLDDEAGVAPAAHVMDPVAVLALARGLGPMPGRVLALTCEPEVRMTGDEADVMVALSEPVATAIEQAIGLLESLVRELVEEGGLER